MKKIAWSVRESFMNEVAAHWPVAKGSLSQVHQRCGRATCRICQAGGRHRVWRYTYRQNGRDYCRHVPEAFAPVLQEALANGRWLEGRLVEAGVELLEAYRRAQAQRTQRKRRNATP